MPHGQILIGIAISLVNIVIHSVIMAMVSFVAHATARVTSNSRERQRLIFVMMAAVSVLMMAHVFEVGVWAAAYVVLGVAPSGGAFYFAFVNYTTLGYGDVLPAEYWRLLGPIAAMNGVLLFGWSTAVIYDVLRTVARQPSLPDPQIS